MIHTIIHCFKCSSIGESWRGWLLKNNDNKTLLCWYWSLHDMVYLQQWLLQGSRCKHRFKLHTILCFWELVAELRVFWRRVVIRGILLHTLSFLITWKNKIATPCSVCKSVRKKYFDTTTIHNSKTSSLLQSPWIYKCITLVRKVAICSNYMLLLVGEQEQVSHQLQSHFLLVFGGPSWKCNVLHKSNYKIDAASRLHIQGSACMANVCLKSFILIQA